MSSLSGGVVWCPGDHSNHHHSHRSNRAPIEQKITLTLNLNYLWFSVHLFIYLFAFIKEQGLPSEQILQFYGQKVTQK